MADGGLSGLSIGALSLTPTFSAGVTSYTARTSNATNKVNATGKNADAQIDISLTNDNGQTTVANGTAATWTTGDNILTITVTESTGAERVYTVTVVKS